MSACGAAVSFAEVQKHHVRKSKTVLGQGLQKKLHMLELNLASLVINGVATLSQVVRLFDIREDATTNAHHPQKLVDVVTWIPG